MLYRGWMLTIDDYARLCAQMERGGRIPIISPHVYALCHHLPNWYRTLTDVTPETIIASDEPDLAMKLGAVSWSRYFVKDFVKSLTAEGGSVVREKSEIAAVLAKIQKYRGTIEGGICVRRYEEFMPGSERRFFVVTAQSSRSSRSFRLTQPRLSRLGPIGERKWDVAEAATRWKDDRRDR